MHRETTEKIARVQARYKVLAETYNSAARWGVQAHWQGTARERRTGRN